MSRAEVELLPVCKNDRFGHPGALRMTPGLHLLTWEYAAPGQDKFYPDG